MNRSLPRPIVWPLEPVITPKQAFIDFFHSWADAIQFWGDGGFGIFTENRGITKFPADMVALTVHASRSATTPCSIHIIESLPQENVDAIINSAFYATNADPTVKIGQMHLRGPNMASPSPQDPGTEGFIGWDIYSYDDMGVENIIEWNYNGGDSAFSMIAYKDGIGTGDVAITAGMTAEQATDLIYAYMLANVQEQTAPAAFIVERTAPSSIAVRSIELVPDPDNGFVNGTYNPIVAPTAINSYLVYNFEAGTPWLPNANAVAFLNAGWDISISSPPAP